MSERDCENCCYAKTVTRQIGQTHNQRVTLECRRYPPDHQGFPEVGSLDWCGEWEPRYKVSS